MKLIVAVDQNWGIGRDNRLLVRIPADLKRFQSLTTGFPVILGRKTLETFPGGRPLPRRRNFILSTQRCYQVPDAEVFPSIDALLAVCPHDAFVIGGESVYRALLPLCETAYVTKIAGTFGADAFFPNLDALPDWVQTETQPPLDFEGLGFQYVTYARC